MNISLTPELEQFIKEKVASGRYHSSSEVIREALRLLQDRELIRQEHMRALNEKIQAGLDDIAAGRVVPEADFKSHISQWQEELHTRRDNKNG